MDGWTDGWIAYLPISNLPTHPITYLPFYCLPTIFRFYFQLSDVPEVSSEANTPPDDLSSSRNKTGSGSSRSGTSNAAPTATSAAAESSGHTSISVSGAGYSGLSFQNFSSDSAKVSHVLNLISVSVDKAPVAFL